MTGLLQIASLIVLNAAKATGGSWPPFQSISFLVKWNRGAAARAKWGLLTSADSKFSAQLQGVKKEKLSA